MPKPPDSVGMISDRQLSPAFVEAWQGPLYGFALRLCGNPDDAWDFVQDTWVQLLLGLDTYDGSSRASTWVFGILRNVTANGRRWRQVRRTTDLDMDDPPTWSDYDVVETAEIVRRVLTEGMEELSELQRAVVHLRDICHFSYDDIAAELGLSSDEINTHLSHGRRKLRNFGVARLDIELDEFRRSRPPRKPSAKQEPQLTASGSETATEIENKPASPPAAGGGAVPGPIDLDPAAGQ